MIGITSRLNAVTKRATSYSFYLISTTPLTSTVTANVSRDLAGATVICQDGFTDAALKDKMSLHGEAFLMIILRLVGWQPIYNIATLHNCYNEN
jgi:hypothetical protein